MRRLPLALAVVALASAAAVAPAYSASHSNVAKFGKPVMLPKFDGGEPSLAVDGKGGVYVTAPQGLAAGTPGVAFWGSHDHGKTFPIALTAGSSTGGGDSDVTVGKDGTIYIADLEVTANAICKSTNGGTSFVDSASGLPCNGNVLAQHGYVSDREWLNPGSDGALYLTYHDFHVEFPYTLRSSDGGRTFVPCGPDSFSPGTGGEWTNFTAGPTSGTQVPKPVIGREGQIYTMFATATPPADGGFDHLWLTTTSSCSPASVWTTYPIYAKAGASLSQPFDGLGADGGGTLYVIAGGHLGNGDSNDNIWLFRSDDGGKTWSKPIRVNTPGLRANMLPTVAGGLKKGQVAIGWYGASGSSRSDAENAWRYYVATSFDGGRSFAQTAVTGVMHEGPQARALLDFTSIAVEPGTGAVFAVFAGDYNGPRRAYVVRQTGGRYLR